MQVPYRPARATVPASAIPIQAPIPVHASSSTTSAAIPRKVTVQKPSMPASDEPNLSEKLYVLFFGLQANLSNPHDTVDTIIF
jgi:hypothetical protein